MKKIILDKQYIIDRVSIDINSEVQLHTLSPNNNNNKNEIWKVVQVIY